MTTPSEAIPAKAWTIAAPARRGWVAFYKMAIEHGPAATTITRPLAGWDVDGMALVVDAATGRLTTAVEYRRDEPDEANRLVFVSVGTDDLDREIGVVPGQGWTLRHTSGAEYPVIAFTVGPHWAHPVCVASTDPARVYTPEGWRNMQLIPPSGQSTSNGDPQ